MSNSKKDYSVPIAIVVAGVLIAGALFAALRAPAPRAADRPAPTQEEQVDNTNKVRAVAADDHIKGNPNAKVTIVEYSDFECPFCSRVHQTLGEVVKEDSEVRWVFRQFPLDQLHPRNARKAAEASECVAKLGGNDAFWKFTDKYFNDTLANDQWNIDDELAVLVGAAGVNKAAFDTCYNAREFKDKVQTDVDNAVATGGRGTPWSIIISPNGKTFELNGAQPKSAVKQLIDLAKQN